MIYLPSSELQGEKSLEECISDRRSVREYSSGKISLEHLAQMLWSCQGITDPRGLRSAPSAGALYPLEVFAFARDVEGLDPGIYRYVPAYPSEKHAIIKVSEIDNPSVELADRALGQDCIKNAPLNIVIAGVVERVAVKYGERAERYMLMETGHAAQNLVLQANALGLGAVTVGAFYEDKVSGLLNYDAEPLYIICIGQK